MFELSENDLDRSKKISWNDNTTKYLMTHLDEIAPATAATIFLFLCLGFAVYKREKIIQKFKNCFWSESSENQSNRDSKIRMDFLGQYAHLCEEQTAQMTLVNEYIISNNQILHESIEKEIAVRQALLASWKAANPSFMLTPVPESIPSKCLPVEEFQFLLESYPQIDVCKAGSKELQMAIEERKNHHQKVMKVFETYEQL